MRQTLVCIWRLGESPLGTKTMTVQDTSNNVETRPGVNIFTSCRLSKQPAFSYLGPDSCFGVDWHLTETDTCSWLLRRMTYLLPPFPNPGVVGGRVISARMSGLGENIKMVGKGVQQHIHKIWHWTCWRENLTCLYCSCSASFSTLQVTAGHQGQQRQRESVRRSSWCPCWRRRRSAARKPRVAPNGQQRGGESNHQNPTWLKFFLASHGFEITKRVTH